MSSAVSYRVPEVFPHVEITRKQLEPCLGNLQRFLKRYALRFYRVEQAAHASTYIEGLLSDLPRKTCEPIALDHAQQRWLLQHFIGRGVWDDEEIVSELQEQVRKELSDPQGILILDGSNFPKKGAESCGVQRQWCGRLGKVENCQAALFLAYAGSGNVALIDHRLYLPKEWTRSLARRRKTHVPRGIRFRTKIEITDDLLRKSAARFPHAWIVGDDEFGRPAWFRHKLGRRRERYLLEVPSNTRIRDLEAPAPPRRSRRGNPPKSPFLRASVWAHQQPSASWTRLRVRAGEKGPLEVEAIRTRVQCGDRQRIGPIETLLVTRTLGPEIEYRFYLSNAEPTVTLEEMVRAAHARHLIEECFERAKGEAGLAQYEVRSWIGWHHHVTLSLVATWFLTLEQRRVGKKDAGSDGPTHGLGLSHAVA